MVAYDPRSPWDPAEMLSAPTLELLREAISAHWSAFRLGGEPARADAAGPLPGEAEARLAHAIAVAAEEARRLDLRPEVLLLQIRRVEESVVQVDRRTPTGLHGKFHERLVAALLRAYFAGSEGSEPRD